jgi:hypothetical protein
MTVASWQEQELCELAVHGGSGWQVPEQPALSACALALLACKLAAAMEELIGIETCVCHDLGCQCQSLQQACKPHQTTVSAASHFNTGTQHSGSLLTCALLARGATALLLVLMLAPVASTVAYVRLLEGVTRRCTPPKAALAVPSAISEVRADLVAVLDEREGLIILAPTYPSCCTRCLAAMLLGRDTAGSSSSSKVSEDGK